MSKETTNLEAYDYYLQGINLVERYTKEDTAAALVKFEKALELDFAILSRAELDCVCSPNEFSRILD